MTDHTPVPFHFGELQPIILESGRGAEYPIHALGPLRGVVEYIQARTQAPVEIAAQSIIAVTSSVVQGFADVDLGPLGGVCPISIYAITIAESGERKSACDSLSKHPLLKFEQEFQSIYNRCFKAWKAKHADFELRLSQYESRVNNDGLEEDEDEPVEPAPPLSPQRYSTEPTTEGLTQLLRNSHPSQAILSDEGGQLLGGYAFSREQAKKSYAFFNSLWNADPIKRTRVGDGSYTLYGRRLSMHLMVQKGVATDLLTDNRSKDMGFLARCLITEPASRIGYRQGLENLPDDIHYQSFCRRIRSLLLADLQYHNGDTPEEGRICSSSGALKLEAITLTKEASAKLLRYYDFVEFEQRKQNEYESLRSVASKSVEQAARLAGLFAIYRDEQAVRINAKDMEDAIELAQYYLNEAKRIMDRAPVAQINREAQDLSDWLSTRSAEYAQFTPSAVQRSGPSFARERPKLDQLLSDLEKYNHIARLEPGTIKDGKARSKIYALHPDLIREASKRTRNS